MNNLETSRRADALATLGQRYWRGEGVPENLVDAARCLIKAHENGDKSAAEGLRYLADELDEQKNYIEAAKCYEVAALCGWNDAMCLVGHYYREGRQGVPQDFTQAASWYRCASADGHETGSFWLGIFYSYGMAVTKNDTEAARFFELALTQSTKFPEAAYRLGKCYLYGRGLLQNNPQAYRWLKMAVWDSAGEAWHDEGTATLCSLVSRMSSDELYDGITLSNADSKRVRPLCAEDLLRMVLGNGPRSTGESS